MSDTPPRPASGKFLRVEAAQYSTDQGCPISPKTLQKMATLGGGPRYHIWGNKAVYLKKDLDDWIVEKLGKGIRSTSELPPEARRRKNPVA